MICNEKKLEIRKKLEIWSNLVSNLDKTDLEDKENNFIKQIQKTNDDYQQEFANQLDEFIKKVATWTFSDSFERMRIFSGSYPWETGNFLDTQKGKIIFDSFQRIKVKVNIKQQVIFLIRNFISQLGVLNEQFANKNWEKEIEKKQDLEEVFEYSQKILTDIFSCSEVPQKWINKLSHPAKSFINLQVTTNIVLAKRSIARVSEYAKSTIEDNMFAKNEIASKNDFYFGYMLPKKREEAWKRIEELEKIIENTTVEPFLDNLGLGKKQPNDIKIITRCKLIFMRLLEDIVELGYHAGGKGVEYEEEGDDRDKYIRDIWKAPNFSELEKVTKNFISKQGVVNLLERVYKQVIKVIKLDSMPYDQRPEWSRDWLENKQKFIGKLTYVSQLNNYCRVFLIDILSKVVIPEDQLISKLENKLDSYAKLETLSNNILISFCLQRKRSELEKLTNQVKIKFNTEVWELLEILLSAQKEVAQNDNFFASKQLEVIRESLVKKMGAEEVQNILNKQLEIVQLEKQLQNLEIFEDLCEQFSTQAQIQIPPK